MMRKAYKTVALLLTAVMLMSMLSGCMDTATQIMIGENGRTTFVQAAYIAEKFISDCGQTPEEYYKTQIEAGGTLSSMECNGNKYWGIVPTPQFYESFDAFCEAMQESSSTLVTAYKDPEYGYETVIFNIPSINKVAEENGQDASQDTSGYADLLVFTANLNIAGSWYGIDRSGKGKDVVRFDFEEENHVLDLIMPCTDEEYQVKIWGSSVPEEEEEDKLITSLHMNLDSPREGQTPYDVYLEFTIDGVGSIDHKYTEEDWFDMDTEYILEDTEPFKEGGAYGVKFTIYAQEGSAFSDDFTAYINGEPAISDFPENDKPGQRTFGLIFDRLAGGDISGYKTISVRVAEPKAGAQPQAPSDVTLDKDVIFRDGDRLFGEIDYLWLVSDNEGKEPQDWSPMGKEGMETFEEGHYYAFYASVFVNSDVARDLEGLINGGISNQWAMPLRRNDKGHITFFHNFGKLEAAQPEKPAEEQKPEEKPPVTPEKPPVTDLQPPVMPGVSKSGNPFTDVKESDYYYDAVDWAFNAEPQITDGNGKDKFMPEQFCTRGQVVTFLWRAAGCPEPKNSKNPFTDVKESDYFYKPVLWAVERGITDGTTPTTFSPASTCKNSHILTFIWRAVGEPDGTGKGQWWEDPLNWANKTGMLEGSYTGKYDVNADCPRSNVVYYLYNYSRL